MGSWGGARDPEGTDLTPVEEEGSGTVSCHLGRGYPLSISVVTLQGGPPLPRSTTRQIFQGMA